VNSTAILRNVRVSARKARLVVDLVRGRNVPDAVEILSFLPKKSAPLVRKLIESAAANLEFQGARSQIHVNVDALYVKEIFVDAGPTLRRFRPRAQGRATKVLKKTSNITVMLETR